MTPVQVNYKDYELQAKQISPRWWVLRETSNDASLTFFGETKEACFAKRAAYIRKKNLIEALPRSEELSLRFTLKIHPQTNH